MTKKRKLKKEVIILIFIGSFFIVYALAFKFGTQLDRKNEIPVKQEQEDEDNRSLMTQISLKDKIYISDSKVENIKIEKEYWDEIKYLFKDFSKIRKPEKYGTIYNGYSDDGIRFSTDLNYFRVYTVNKEEFYKIPVEKKKEVEKVLNDSIYTSFDLIKQYKTWKNVELIYGGEIKTIRKWKYDDLSYKMASKRMVGKVQPEKSKERSKYNFTINIEGENYAVKVETMGKDYVKITCGNTSSYYEAYTGLFEYIRDEIFKIGVKS